LESIVSFSRHLALFRGLYSEDILEPASRLLPSLKVGRIGRGL
jgi:hypothetical protein